MIEVFNSNNERVKAAIGKIVAEIPLGDCSCRHALQGARF